MRQRVHLITLGVDDQETAAEFCDALGWSHAESPDGVIAYDLWGATLGLYPRAKLAEDMGRDLPKGECNKVMKTPSSCRFAHCSGCFAMHLRRATNLCR